MKSFVGTIIGGITIIAVTAVILKNSNHFGTVVKGATHDYSRIATTFQNP